MGYDYSLTFLGRNHEVVMKLIDVAKTGNVLTYESETWEPVRQQYQLIRGVLANMSVNMKEYKDIRTKIRTWTEATEAGFRLNVGVPNHKVSGRPPGMPSTKWQENYVPKATSTAVYQHPGTIDDLESYEVLVGKMMALPPNVNLVEAKFAGLTNTPEQLEVLDDQLARVPFKPVAIEGSILILKRR